MKRANRRHRTCFGYIGFGNNHSVFNQSSNKAFSHLKNKLDEESHYHFKLNFSHHNLTKAERETIKNNIRKAEKRRLQKTIIVFCFTAIAVGYFIKLAIDNFMSRL